MSHMVYNADKDVVLNEVQRLESEGHTRLYEEPRWNEFGQCWIVMMEKPKSE